MHYFAGVVDEVPRQVAAAFARMYDVYKEDVNKAGVYFNEAPPEGITARVVIVGDCDKDLTIGARHKVYVLGKANVSLIEQAQATVNYPDAEIYAYDTARVTMRAGRAWMFGSSSFVVSVPCRSLFRWFVQMIHYRIALLHLLVAQLYLKQIGSRYNHLSHL